MTIKGAHQPPKAQRSSMETLIIDIEQVNQWRIPPFQRPLRVNAKVIAIAEDMKSNGVSITGVITLGKITKDNTTWVVDGQHRIEAFRISGLAEVIADLRIVHFDDMGDMADEFVRLNSAIARMRPDDILRGLEPSVPALRQIREACPFVGYDQIRRGGNAGPIVGMNPLLRCWSGSAHETPVANKSNMSTGEIAKSLDAESTKQLILFMTVAHAAWGRDPEYFRLWGNLNLALCMWLWRQIVLDTKRGGNRRVVAINIAQFKQCLMSVSASANYLDWLPGHILGDRDRSPAYIRLKAIFVKRLQEELRTKVNLPSPAWASR